MITTPLYPMPLVPIGSKHPGAFGAIRSHDVHTGVDLYAPHGSPVRAMESGRVVKVSWFTGAIINMPWWHDTRAVLIRGETGLFGYCEIQEMPGIFEGDYVAEGQLIGYVTTVLKKFKGRPMSMLHVELYKFTYWGDWCMWKLNDPQPFSLLDPTPHLLNLSGYIDHDPYVHSVLEAATY